MYMNVERKIQSCRVEFVRLKHIKLLLLVIILCLVNGELLCAQNQNTKNSQNKKKENNEKENISFRDRWSFRTNALDWLLLAPNVGVEFDLSSSVYNRSTLLLNIKGNWKTTQTYKSPLLYNFLDLRSEYRYYWRTRKRAAQLLNEPMTVREKLFSRSRLNPRSWRAYYLGGYVDANRYTIKLARKGLQGTSVGIGISTGFGIPLYSFKHGFLDFELGGSIGFVMAEYDVFTYDRASNCYPVEKTKLLHFVPFPVINDLRVAFVYRFASIKDKYNKINYKKIEAKQERERLRDSVNVARKLEKEAQKMLVEKDKELKLQKKKEKKNGTKVVQELTPKVRREE